MTLLTEQEINEEWQYLHATKPTLAQLASVRAIEARVRAKVIKEIKAQGVAAWASDDGRTVVAAEDVEYIPNWTDYYRTPLYRLHGGDTVG